MEMLIKLVADLFNIKLPQKGAELVEQDIEFTETDKCAQCRGMSHQQEERDHLQRSSMDKARSWVTH